MHVKLFLYLFNDLDDENKVLKKVVEEKNKLSVALKEQTAELSIIVTIYANCYCVCDVIIYE